MASLYVPNIIFEYLRQRNDNTEFAKARGEFDLKSSMNTGIFAKDENKKVYPLFKELLVLFIVLSFSICTTFTLGIRGFVNLWIGKENYLVSFFTIVLFSIILFFRIMNLPLIAVINAKGYFKENGYSGGRGLILFFI